MTGIFKNWTAKQTAEFKDGLVVAKHHLPDMPLFSNDALARLIETHPDSLSMVYAMPKKVEGQKQFREGDLRGASGKEVIEGINKGQLWVQLLRLDEVNDAYKDLEQNIISEMERNNPKLKIYGCRLSLLISSPGIHVSYHADIPHNALWQIRGDKRLYVYPAEEHFISQNDLEGVFLGETQEAIHYEPEFDQHATVLDLTPGEMVTWPVNGPHRIENANMLSVSLAMEYFDAPVLRRYAVHFTNGILRRRFELTNLSTKTTGPIMWSKAIMAGIFKLLKVQKKHKRTRYLTFKVDPQSESGFVDIPKTVRDY